LSILVGQNVDLAVIAALSVRPNRGLPNGLGARSEGRSGLRRSGPHGLAIGQPIFAHWRIPGTDGGHRFASKCNER
jgi:hypothetical protein